MAPSIFYVMGVSGSGKTTVGRLLAEKLHIPFLDGDDFHPKANIEKMEAGIPLTDSDRFGWLQILHDQAIKHLDTGAVIACSALKKSYRDILKAGIGQKTTVIYLKGSYAEIADRMRHRHGHFMPTALLQSQFDDLEEPIHAFTLDISDTPENLVQAIITAYNLVPGEYRS